MMLKPFAALVMLATAFSTSLALAGTEPAARVGDWVLTVQEIDKLAQGSLYELQQQMLAVRLRKVQELVSARLVNLEAKERNISPEELLKQEIENKIEPVTDEQVKKFISDNKEKLPADAESSKVENQVREYMKVKAVEKAENTFLEALAVKFDAKVLLKPLPRPRFDIPGPNDLVLGNAKAPVTIIEFSDFECPYCRRAHEVLKRIQKEHADDIRLVYRHFPLQFHKQALKAAEASQCANDQNKFWEYHDKIFDNPQRMAVGELEKMAEEMGLDTSRFNKCLEEGKHTKRVMNDVRVGEELGVTGTPTFFVNGLRMVGSVPFEDLKQAIMDEKSGGKKDKQETTEKSAKSSKSSKSSKGKE